MEELISNTTSRFMHIIFEQRFHYVISNFLIRVRYHISDDGKCNIYNNSRFYLPLKTALFAHATVTFVASSFSFSVHQLCRQNQSPLISSTTVS